MLVPAAQLGYSLDFLVAVRLILHHLPSTKEAANELIWPATDARLRALADTHPDSLVCFHEPFVAPDARGCHVNLVLPDKTVVWLGRLGACDIPLEPQDDGPEEIEVIRDAVGCTITTNTEPPLKRSDLEAGIHAYCRVYCPTLAELPIRWLEEKMSDTFAREIQYRLRHHLD